MSLKFFKVWRLVHNNNPIEGWTSSFLSLEYIACLIGVKHNYVILLYFIIHAHNLVLALLRFQLFDLFINKHHILHIVMNEPTKFIGLALVGKDIVFRFKIEYSSLRDFGPKVIGLFLYEDFWKMIFWLVLKLEISYRVIMFWRIFVSFKGFFEDYIFAWWNIWVSIILLLPSKIHFSVNGKAIVWQKPHSLVVWPNCCARSSQGLGINQPNPRSNLYLGDERSMRWPIWYCKN